MSPAVALVDGVSDHRRQSARQSLAAAGADVVGVVGGADAASPTQPGPSAHPADRSSTLPSTSPIHCPPGIAVTATAVVSNESRSLRPSRSVSPSPSTSSATGDPSRTYWSVARSRRRGHCTLGP
uniref:hypothetical protein n=1 Tax=Halogranum amylolyticum TaxID=660520 RepID=UPI001114FCD6|nr:hypothetical protein [Halogranum amylolyticum]